VSIQCQLGLWRYLTWARCTFPSGQLESNVIAQHNQLPLLRLRTHAKLPATFILTCTSKVTTRTLCMTIATAPLVSSSNLLQMSFTLVLITLTLSHSNDQQSSNCNHCPQPAVIRSLVVGNLHIMWNPKSSYAPRLQNLRNLTDSTKKHGPSWWLKGLHASGM